MNAEEIRALRRRLGLTQAAFAARYHLSPRVVANWEKARAKARETRIGRNSCLVRSSEIGANLADFLAGTERKSGWLKDSGSHLLFDRVQKFALTTRAIASAS